MTSLRPRDQSIWDPRPVLHETKTNYCETETKKLVSRPCWSRDLNIPEICRYFLNISIFWQLLMSNLTCVNYIFVDALQ